MIETNDPGRTRLAVLGSPIAHSRSPLLHRAAYAALGLPWTYERHEIGEGGLEAFLLGLDRSWRGCSLTMPLKREALDLVQEASPVAMLTKAVNTLSFVDGVVRGHNTDVRGVVTALRTNGVASPRDPWILGAGATAGSVIAALGRMGAPKVRVTARRPAQAAALTGLANKFNVDLQVVPWDRNTKVDHADLVVNTIPQWSPEAGLAFPEDVRRHVPLFEVVYDPWPSPLADGWFEADGKVISGLEMLLHQAVAQVRIFATGDENAPLPDEQAVLAAMRQSIA
ncbi:MAG: shikimate dehydrogenase [Microbacteriaceae bacterium]|nr:shikimate dehydrogenase [Microbacteriaceae bacterium]